MNIDKIAGKVANFINGSEKMQGVLRSCSKNPALWFSGASFIVQTTARPLTTIAISPNSDGIYGACSSISSAITELVGSYAIFKPMSKAIDKSSEELYKTKGMFFENPKLLRQYKSVTNRVAKQPATLLISLVRFSLVGPTALLLNKIGISKKDKNNRLDVKA